MIVIEVERADVQERTGTRDNGQPWKIRNQVVYAHLFDAETGSLKRYPTEVKLRLQDDQKPYQPGFYMLSPTSIYSDRYDALAVDAHLVAVDEAIKLAGLAVTQRVPKTDHAKTQDKAA
ncbi:single-stranded DNA-binding protein [Chromobacterium sp. ASV23]|uniref:single-stranded DNA-binding protein n=1 Tax=Chromobacterium sp. ASV23 TaxID=2795110 RepID=UPI0018ED61CB|nr:single-stranded DNA-binding protein [Chromobacterium sp. ASV23]